MYWPASDCSDLLIFLSGKHLKLVCSSNFSYEHSVDSRLHSSGIHYNLELMLHGLLGQCQPKDRSLTLRWLFNSDLYRSNKYHHILISSAALAAQCQGKWLMANTCNCAAAIIVFCKNVFAKPTEHLINYDQKEYQFWTDLHRLHLWRKLSAAYH